MNEHRKLVCDCFKKCLTEVLKVDLLLDLIQIVWRYYCDNYLGVRGFHFSDSLEPIGFPVNTHMSHLYSWSLNYPYFSTPPSELLNHVDFLHSSWVHSSWGIVNDNWNNWEQKKSSTFVSHLICNARHYNLQVVHVSASIDHLKGIRPAMRDMYEQIVVDPFMFETSAQEVWFWTMFDTACIWKDVKSMQRDFQMCKKNRMLFIVTRNNERSLQGYVWNPPSEDNCLPRPDVETVTDPKSYISI